jgi:precorrin-3B methylase
MLSLVVVGNSATRLAAGRMITPRGYLDKYGTKTGQ